MIESGLLWQRCLTAGIHCAGYAIWSIDLDQSPTTHIGISATGTTTLPCAVTKGSS